MGQGIRNTDGREVKRPRGLNPIVTWHKSIRDIQNIECQRFDRGLCFNIVDGEIDRTGSVHPHRECCRSLSRNGHHIREDIVQAHDQWICCVEVQVDVPVVRSKNPSNIERGCAQRRTNAQLNGCHGQPRNIPQVFGLRKRIVEGVQFRTRQANFGEVTDVLQISAQDVLAVHGHRKERVGNNRRRRRHGE